METIRNRIILVIGDNHEEIARKYSADLKDNKQAYYKWEHCQDKRFKKTGEEGTFSDPFILKNGEKSYSARFNDIDWSKMHRNQRNLDLSKRVWELVVDDDRPLTEEEVLLKERMKNRISYFKDNFDSVTTYVQYYSNLWYYGVATDKKYEEVNGDDKSVLEWCINYFDRYLKGLEEENPLITIYETRCLE